MSFELERDSRGCCLFVGETADLTPGGKKKGIVKRLLEKGDEKAEYPNYGDKIEFEYTAYQGKEMNEETIFDSSERDGKPFVYECLKGRVVRGFEQAVLTMKPGERAIIYLEPEYAFGKEGSAPRVAPNTPVIFDTKILSVTSPDLSVEQDGSITKKTILKGTGFDYPNQGAEVTIDIRGEYEAGLFMDRTVTFPLGEGRSKKYEIPSCVEDHLDHWKLEERARLFVAAKHTNGINGLPENVDLSFIITMKDFKRAKDSWKMNSAEKLGLCKVYKEKGNSYYQNKEYDLAEKFYSMIVDLLSQDMSMDGPNEENRKHVIQITYQNLAQAQLKLGQFASARDSCDEALKIDANSQKAYFRRGMAWYNLLEFSKAQQDFKKVLDIDPRNEEAEKYLRLSIKQLRESNSEMKVLATKMIAAVIGKDERS